MYQVIYRTPDNTDGIYRDGQLVISERTLERNGYTLRYLLRLPPKRLNIMLEELVYALV